MKLKFILCIVAVGFALFSCDVPEKGFFSHEGIRMREDTVEVIRGLYQASAVPEIDGSTRPLLYEAVAVYDLRTNKEVAVESYPVQMWSESFHPDVDSTMELVSKKMVIKEVPPFELNSSSGQVFFNGGTTNLESDLYGVDVKVSNVNSSKLFSNYCIFKLVGKPFEVLNGFGDALNGIPSTGEKDRVSLQSSEVGSFTASLLEDVRNNIHPTRRLTKLENGSILKVIFVVRDAEGKPFKGKDLLPWPDDKASYLNNYHDNSIAMDAGSDMVILTDTSCIFTFPTVPWPAFGRSYATGDNLFLSYYCIDWNVCKFSPLGQKRVDDYAQTPGAKTFVTYSPRFRSMYKINETGTWLMEVTNPLVLRKN